MDERKNVGGRSRRLNLGYICSIVASLTLSLANSISTNYLLSSSSLSQSVRVQESREKTWDYVPLATDFGSVISE